MFYLNRNNFCPRCFVVAQVSTHVCRRQQNIKMSVKARASQNLRNTKAPKV